MPPGTSTIVTDTNALQLAGLQLFERRYPAGTRMGRHAHDEWRYCLAVRGTYTDSWRRGHRTRTRGQLSLHPEGESHTSAFHQDVVCFHVEFGGAWRDRLLGMAGIAPEPHEFLDGRVPLIAAQLHDEVRRGDPVTALVIEGLALELIGWSARDARREPGGRGPAWVFRVRELLHDRLSESLSLGEVASAVGVHPVHLARQFRRAFGCSMGDYMRRKRVERACRALDGDAPLSIVALDAGFADQSHFGRVFKRATGMTPGEYRARLR